MENSGKATERHGGHPGAVAEKLGLTGVPEVSLDFSVNVNPFGMPLDLERAFLGMAPAELAA